MRHTPTQSFQRLSEAGWLLVSSQPKFSEEYSHCRSTTRRGGGSGGGGGGDGGGGGGMNLSDGMNVSSARVLLLQRDGRRNGGLRDGAALPPLAPPHFFDLVWPEKGPQGPAVPVTCALALRLFYENAFLLNRVIWHFVQGSEQLKICLARRR